MNYLIKLDKIFMEILEYAERNQVCLRKAVGCAAITFSEIDMSPRIVALVHNGPSREGYLCTNEVGNCGCSHSEPRLIQKIFKEGAYEVRPLAMVCTYSPCTNCANITIDSGLFDGIFYDILTEHDKRGELFLKQVMPVITRQSILQVLRTRETGRIDDQIKKWILSSKS